jgi:GDPmannose 4,6-dehydratase
VALVTGSRGQDGSYLRDLVGQDKSVGCINPFNRVAYKPAKNEVAIDLGEKSGVLDLLRETQPRFVFHLAAKHGPSNEMTFYKEDIEAMRRIHVESTRNLLEAIDSLGLDTHLVVAGSSRIFSANEHRTRINETSTPNPADFYGESKLAAWDLVRRHRNEHGARASFLVLFNHESPRRPKGYFSQDVSYAIQSYLDGTSDQVTVRDADAYGDWSDARDVVKLMASVALSSEGEDFVVGSGSLRSVRDIVESTLKLIGASEASVVSSVLGGEAEKRYSLEADNSKALERGHWKPKILIEETIAEMVGLALE